MTAGEQTDPIVIWPFETVQGGCRLSLQVPRDRASDLRAELWGCSVVADTFDEFIALAARAIQNAGGMLGDILRQPVPTPPLTVKIRGAARVADVLRAADYLLKAFRDASRDEVGLLWSAPEHSALRAYLASVAHSLDERRDDFVSEIASASGLTRAELEEILENAVAGPATPP